MISEFFITHQPCYTDTGLRLRSVAKENGHTLVECICQVIGEMGNLRYWDYMPTPGIGTIERREDWMWMPQISCHCMGRGWVCRTCEGAQWVMRYDTDAQRAKLTLTPCPQCQ